MNEQHEDSGLRCLVAHGDGQGNQQPPCTKCTRCGEWIRPEAMGQECPGKQPIVVIEQILAKLERIPCMSEDCEGSEDEGRAFKHRPVTIRCHRCAAVRLAKSVLP